MTKAKTTKTTKAPATPKTVQAVKVVILTSSASIEAAIKSIATRGKRLEKDVHQAAVSTLVHADKHGDITLAQRLIDAVPNMTRKNALKDWYIAMGKFGYDETNKALVFNGKKSTMLDEAMKTPFWAFKPEPEYKPFDIDVAITQLVARANKATERGDKVDPAKLAQLAKLAA